MSEIRPTRYCAAVRRSQLRAARRRESRRSSSARPKLLRSRPARSRRRGPAGVMRSRHRGQPRVADQGRGRVGARRRRAGGVADAARPGEHHHDRRGAPTAAVAISRRSTTKRTCSSGGGGGRFLFVHNGAGRVMTSLADQRLALAPRTQRSSERGLRSMATATTEWDERLEELHGMAPGTFGGTFEDWIASLYPDDRAAVPRPAPSRRHNPGPYSLELGRSGPTARSTTCECRGMVLVDDPGAPTGTTGVVTDVTDRELRVGRGGHKSSCTSTKWSTLLQQALLARELRCRYPARLIAAHYVAVETSAAVGGDWYAVVAPPMTSWIGDRRRRGSRPRRRRRHGRCPLQLPARR